ncbi:MAG: response regulator, partial [Planctomycetota bacterium]
ALSLPLKRRALLSLLLERSTEQLPRFELADGLLGCRILVAEDFAPNQKVLLALLERLGIHADLVDNGRCAVDRVRDQHYDIVLMDVQMPVMDGLRAVAELRRIEQERGVARTPVLALTAHALRGDRERCLQAGMDGYLSKPIDVHELIGSLERHARRARRTAARRKTEEQRPRTTPVDSESRDNMSVRGDSRNKLGVSWESDPAGPSSRTAPDAPPADDELPETVADMPAMDDGSGDALPVYELPNQDKPSAETTSSPGAGRGGASEPALFDRAAALARMGGDDELLAQVAALYAEDAPPLYERYEQAAASGNAEAARVAAHTLKGICATLGGERAKAAAFAAEAAAAAHVDEALMSGADPANLPPARVADLAPAGAAMTAAARRLAAALADTLHAR